MAEHITRTQQPDGTWNVSGWRDAGSCACPDCGGIIELIEDVEEWFPDTGEVSTLFGQEVGWGLPHGFCESCELAIHGGFECDYVIRLKGRS